MKELAVVTGTSSGIGLATAIALTRAGYDVVATVRDGRGREACRAGADGAGVSFEIRTLDVTHDGAVTDFVGELLGARGRIDVLVNNAGVGHRGTVEQLSLSDIAGCMDVNFYGSVRMIRAVLPAMRLARRGRILTVTSMGAVVGLPFTDAYTAAKCAIEGLLESLAPVASAFGVHVSMIEPGAVVTPFLANMRKTVSDSGDPYAALAAKYAENVAARFSQGEKPEDVADVIVEAAQASSPQLRYQTSASARGIAAQKLVDVTGNSLLTATRGMLGL